MRVVKLPNGNLLVPLRAENEDGVIGDGVEEITPTHPQYAAWLVFVGDNDERDESATP